MCHLNKETGLSVPDSEMLIVLSKVLETSVSTLLGENIMESKGEDLKIISEKLEKINLQLSEKKNKRRQLIHYILIALCIIILIIFIILHFLNSNYLNWDYHVVENAVLGVAFHSMEWLFVRIAPIIFMISFVGILLTRKKF